MTTSRCGLAVLALLAASCAGMTPTRDAAPPRLLVMIAVDGLRGDLPELLEPHLDGGLRRLLRDGRRWQGWVDHAVTVSHAGHVSLATGLHPDRHGIVDAAFYVPGGSDGPVLVDAVEDSRWPVVGGLPGEGASPAQILAPTLAEWVLRTDGEARAVAVGGGRYSSLLHAGGARGAEVAWFDRDAAAFVSSSWYADGLPPWVERFNREKLPRWIEDGLRWTAILPPEVAALGLPDDFPAEADGRHLTLPHVFQEEVPPEQQDSAAMRARWLSWGPLLDAAVLDLALSAVDERALGLRDSTDLLVIVLSQTDSISHYYGPFSQENLDGLVRMDRILGEFFAALDARLGEGRWACALSADHGLPDIAEHRLAEGLPARRLDDADVETIFARVADLGPADADAMADAIRQDPAVAAAFTPRQLMAPPTPGDDPQLILARRSWRPDRVPRLPLFVRSTGESPVARAGLMLKLTEGTRAPYDVVVHGSAEEDDRRVPVLLMGPGVEPGLGSDRARVVDVAPTLARVGGIPVPDGVDGRVLDEP